MTKFSHERNGYSAREVDEFLTRIKLENEEKLREQRDIIFELKKELSTMHSSLSGFENKETQISSALVSAVEKAREIEESARTLYELEIKRVRILYRKWETLLDKIVTKYGKGIVSDETGMLLEEFQKAIKTTLASEHARDVKQDDKSYAKTLLTKMGGVPAGTIVAKHVAPDPVLNQTATAPRAAIAEQDVRMQYTEEVKRLAEKQKDTTNTQVKFNTTNNFNSRSNTSINNNSKDTTVIQNKSGSYGDTKGVAVENSKNVQTDKSKSALADSRKSFSPSGKSDSLADDFLVKDETAMPKVFGQAPKKENAFFNALVPQPMKDYINEKTNGFDLREAVNPTESLEEIMQAFDFYEEAQGK